MTASASSAARVSLAVAMLLVLPACTTMTTIRQHEDFATRRAGIHRVAIVPPQVDATLIVFKGTNEAIPEEVAKVSGTLPELLKRSLESRGFTVAPPVVEESLDPELRSMLTQLRQTTSQVNADMYKTVAMSTSEAMKYRASVGPQVADLASALDADALLLVGYSEFHKSGGQTAQDVTLAVLLAVATLGNAIVLPPKYGATLQVMLVDGVTGEMLWSNITGRTEFVESAIDPLTTGIFMPMEQKPPVLEAQKEPEPPATVAAPPPMTAQPPATPGEKSVEVTMEPAEPEPPAPSEPAPAAPESPPIP